MADAPFTPTEAQIERVLSSYTPRQIAIAYLRARHRARQSDLAFDLMEGVAGLTQAVMKGDMKAAERAVLDAERKARLHREIAEGGGNNPPA